MFIARAYKIFHHREELLFDVFLSPKWFAFFHLIRQVCQESRINALELASQILIGFDF